MGTHSSGFTPTKTHRICSFSTCSSICFYFKSSSAICQRKRTPELKCLKCRPKIKIYEKQNSQNLGECFPKAENLFGEFSKFRSHPFPKKVFMKVNQPNKRIYLNQLMHQLAIIIIVVKRQLQYFLCVNFQRSVS